MKLTKPARLAIFAISSLFAIGYLYQSTTQPCQVNLETNCVVSQQSWLNWLSGNSRSAQFHFVDFLELINQLLPAKYPKQ